MMSAAPQGSNVVQGFAATGMVPSMVVNNANFQKFSNMGLVSQNDVQIDRAGDINVL